MQAEDFWSGIKGQLLDEFRIPLILLMRRGKVNTWGGELVVVIKDVLTVEILKDGGQKTTILVVCDFTTIVALTSQILECIEGSLIWVLVEEDTELSDWDTKIVVVELVRDVPAERAELSSLLNNGVEESKTKDHLAEFSGLYAVIEEVLHVRNRIEQERTVQVSFKTFGRLVCHLNTVL